MNTQVKELFEQARKLSEDERIELADLLYAETAIPYADWEAARVGEAESRLEAYRRGEMQAVDAEEVHARLREKYGFK